MDMDTDEEEEETGAQNDDNTMDHWHAMMLKLL